MIEEDEVASEEVVEEATVEVEAVAEAAALEAEEEVCDISRLVS